MNEQTGAAAPRSWDVTSAAAWDKWFHIIEGGARALSDRMIELAAIGPGARVLDVASGLGDPAVTAARRAGPSGHVLATDLSEEMLGYGRKRAAKLGLANIEFRQMDGQALEVPEAAFDAVLCRWGVMFLADLDAALAGFRCCLKPGGRLVAAFWGPAGRVPGVGLGSRVVHDYLGLAPPNEGAGTPFACSDVAAFERRVAAAGFEEVRGEWVNVPFVFESAEQATRFRRERSKPLCERIAGFPLERQEAAWTALTEAMRAFETPEGTVRLNNAAYCVSARA
ncbi:MAG: class I SAM-dependent methyltransferase [Alphaproteobacteria bacterium]